MKKLTVVLLGFMAIVAQADSYYKTSQTGSWNWSTAGNWSVSTTGGAPWTTATVAPSYDNSTSITILSGASVNVDSDVTIDQTSIEDGGTVVVNPGCTLTVADGTGTDLSVAGTISTSSGTIDVNGSFDATGGHVTFTGAGNLKLAGTVTSLGTLSSDHGTVSYDGASQTILSNTYHNLILTGSDTKTASASLSILGTFVNTMALSIGGVNQSLSVTGASSIGADVTTTGSQTYNGALTITANTKLDADDDNIVFKNTVTSEANEHNTLQLSAGTGSIEFDDSVGVGANQKLGDIKILTAANVTADNTIEATSLTQSAGTGTTTFSGAITLAAGTFKIDTTLININDNVSTTGGNIDLDSSGSVNLASGKTIRTTAAYNSGIISGTINIDAVNITASGTIDSSGAARGGTMIQQAQVVLSQLMLATQQL